MQATAAKEEVCNGMAGDCLTDVLHSSTDYHQEHAAEYRRQPKDVWAAWGAVVLVICAPDFG